MTAYEDETYHLFYATTSSTWPVNRISWSFRTGEFSHGVYAGHEFVRAVAFKFSRNVAEQIIASTNDLVYELETTNGKDDTTAVDRYYETDWNPGGSEFPSPFRGARFIFKRAKGVRVKISMASDFRESFSYEESFDLRGTPGEETAIVDYVPPQNLECIWINVKIRFFHDSTTKGELRAILPLPQEPVSRAEHAQASLA